MESDEEKMARLERKMLEDTIWLRREFFRRVPVLTIEEISLAPVMLASGGRAAVEKWRSERQIFGLGDGDRAVFPSFQFDSDGSPKQIVARLLSIFAQVKSRTDWDNALWFLAANDWLDGPSPIELLATDPDLVIDAAEQAVLPIIE